MRLTTTNGGLGKGESPELQIAGQPERKLALTKGWRYHESTPTSSILTAKGEYPQRRYIYSGCYHAMIAPLAPFAIKGVLWYQGEGDVGNGGGFYHSALTSMIGDWRTLFGNPQMPFYLVQLSAFGRIPDQPVNSGWAEVREAQWQVCREIPNTGFAVSIDRGEIYDIHPSNKQDMAKRLAAFALGQTYGQKISYLSPSYKSMKVEGKSIRLSFDGAEGGLVNQGGVPTGFEIAGTDGKYVWANAVIDGETILVSSPEVENPVSARYGWSDHPLCNVYNRAGFPASPFRTAK